MTSATESAGGPAFRLAKRGISVSFFGSGFIAVLWVTRLPAIRDSLHLSDTQVGVLLMSSAIGALLAVAMTGRLSERWGSGLLLRWSFPGMALFATIIGAAPTLWIAVLGALTTGFAFGMTDATMNTQAATLERRSGVKLMSGMHARWSMGSAAAAAWGAVTAAIDLPVSITMATAAAVWIAMALATDRHFIQDEQAERLTTTARPRLPKAIVGIGLIMFASFLIEATVTGWTTLYLHDQLALTAAAAAMGYFSFEFFMVVGRLFGDRWRLARGDHWVAAGGAAAATAGLALVALAPIAGVALLGLAVTALGQCNLVPVSFAAAEQSAPGQSAVAISRVAVFAYVGGLSGPFAFGFLADHVGLRTGWAVLTALSVMATLLAYRFIPREA